MRPPFREYDDPLALHDSWLPFKNCPGLTDVSTVDAPSRPAGRCRCRPWRHLRHTSRTARFVAAEAGGRCRRCILACPEKSPYCKAIPEPSQAGSVVHIDVNEAKKMAPGGPEPDERGKSPLHLGHVEQLGDVNRICAASLSHRGNSDLSIATAHLSQFLPKSTCPRCAIIKRPAAFCQQAPERRRFFPPFFAGTLEQGNSAPVGPGLDCLSFIKT